MSSLTSGLYLALILFFISDTVCENRIEIEYQNRNTDI